MKHLNFASIEDLHSAVQKTMLQLDKKTLSTLFPLFYYGALTFEQNPKKHSEIMVARKQNMTLNNNDHGYDMKDANGTPRESKTFPFKTTKMCNAATTIRKKRKKETEKQYKIRIKDDLKQKGDWLVTDRTNGTIYNISWRIIYVLFANPPIQDNPTIT